MVEDIAKIALVTNAIGFGKMRLRSGNATGNRRRVNPWNQLFGETVKNINGSQDLFMSCKKYLCSVMGGLEDLVRSWL
jgi:hypothetical protein